MNQNRTISCAILRLRQVTFSVRTLIITQREELIPVGRYTDMKHIKYFTLFVPQFMKIYRYKDSNIYNYTY